MLSAFSPIFGESKDTCAEVSKDSPTLNDSRFDKVFKDFIFTARVRTLDAGKAVLKFHTDKDGKRGYMVAIDNDIDNPQWWRASGSLLYVRNVVNKFAKDKEWFNLKVKVHGAQICVWINDTLIVEYIEPAAPYREIAHKQMLLSSGNFALNYVGGGKVQIQDLAIHKLPARADSDNQRFNAIDEQKDCVIKLHQRDFPVLDFHVHLKGGFTPDWAFAKSRKIGVNFAIAPNCGKDFELNEEKKALDFIKYERQNYPFIICMQAEGREWYKLFGANVRNKFEYVFTDAMTFNDLKGKRTHIWRDNEVDCPKGSEEAYMDLIVDTICQVLANEPADIYANPMRLPNILKKDAAKYWTATRRQKVLDALVASGKVLEINMLTALPDNDFIKAAKARGVKFSFGSNNKDENFGNFEAAASVIEACNLVPSDIFNPQKAYKSK